MLGPLLQAGPRVRIRLPPAQSLVRTFEIQRELRATAMRANHIILMGYSLPRDDVTYRAFFSARRGHWQRRQPVRCTIVNRDTSNPNWYGPDALRSLDLPKDHVVEAARDIFGPENVRFYGGGIPNVFLDGGDLVPLMNRVNCLLIGFP